MAVRGAETNADRAAPPRRLRWPGVLAAAVLALACQREEVAHFRVPKESTVPAAVEANASAAPAEGGIRWKLPPGWTETPGGGPMRYATIAVPSSVGGKVEVTVIRLPGPAGGELANVNRWRNQLSLPPITEADLPGARKVLKTPAGPLNVYEFNSGPKKARTVAGFAELQGESWFLKMTGDDAAVVKARAAFLDLLGSVHLEAR